MLQLQAGDPLRATAHQLLADVLQILIRAVALQHSLPGGAVTHFLGQQYFQQPRKITRLHPCNGLCLRRALIDPTRGQLGFPRDTHLHAGGIGQIDNVGHLTVTLGPVGLATGALGKVTLLRAHDAAIAGRQLAKTGKAVALIKTFLGQTITGNTLNPAREFEAQRLPEMIVQAEPPLIRKQGVTNRLRELGVHFSQAALPVTHISSPSTPVAGGRHNCPRLWRPCR